VLVALPVVATGVATYLAFLPERSGSLAFWMLLFGMIVALGVIGAAWGAHEVLLGEWLKPKAGDFTRGWIGAAIFYFAAWVFARTVAPVGSRHEIWLVSLYAQLGDPRSLQAHAVALFVAIFVAAMAEEVVWRGMVTQLLADRVGSRAAWLWAAGLYALAHAPSAAALQSTAGWNPVLVAAALGGGLLWGAMMRWFGRLVPGIVAHTLFDWAVAMMFPLWGGGWSIRS
jgi:membrane protease YdiL (CAAX protease family)